MSGQKLSTFALSVALLAVLCHVPPFHTGLAAKQQPKYRLAALLARVPLTSRPSITTCKDDNDLFLIFILAVILGFSLEKQQLDFQKKKIRTVVLVGLFFSLL